MPSMRSSSHIAPTQQGPLGSNRSDNSDTMRSDDFKLTGAARRMQVLLETNSLLEKMGFGTRSFEDYDDLVASVSSMSVALYEKLFQFHLEHVVRVPEHAQDYIHNAQLVVDALSGALLDESFDTEHVTGASLCDGDVASIQQLVRMFVQIYEILYAEQQPPPLLPEEDENDRNEYDQVEEEMEMQGGEYEQRHGDDDDDDEQLPTQRGLSATAQKKKRGDVSEKKQKPSASRQSARAAATHNRNSHSHSQSHSGGSSSTGNGNGISSKKAELRATGSAANSRTARSTRTPLAKQSLHAGASSTTMKKRTRHVNETHATVNRKEMIHTSNATLEKELLTTQRYGRFVPVPQRSARRGNDRHGRDYPANEDEGGEGVEGDEGGDGLELLEEELAAGETYFGGVSSVSGASGSSASIHFMEEEGDFAKNFSNIQSHSSPGTDSKDSPETGTDSTPDHPSQKPPIRQNKNQQHAETDPDANSPSTSPLKKKVAMAQQPTMSPTGNNSSKKPTTTASAGANAVKEEAPFSVLYPLTPETTRHDRTSNAHKEHLRYKIQLKDHLQELRHREFCQRQHLERAYRLGEHTATVERIRARRFEQELRLHRIAVNLDAKTQEEKQLRDAMQHMLHLEKEKLRDEHKTTKHVLRTIQQEHAEREQAMEAFYATQIQLVKEQTRRELTEREAVEKAHRMASEQMIREMKRDRERELSELLTEKQHLAQVRRFRHATQLTHAIDRGTEVSQRQGDAFYAAAMKARQLRAMPTSSSSSSSRNTTTDTRGRPTATAAKTKTKTKTTGTAMQSRHRATASIYNSTTQATHTERRRTVVRV